jgi:Flp pilus assembly protein TadB
MAIKLKYHHHQQRRQRRRRICCCFPTLIFWLLAIAGIGLWCFTLIIIYAHYLRHHESWWILQQQQQRHAQWPTLQVLSTLKMLKRQANIPIKFSACIK